MIQSFTDLITWKKAYELTIKIYKVTEEFPKKELFGITSQLRRAAVSISSNIAEGFSRISNKEKIQFLYISLGSLTEVQNLLMLSRDFKYLSLDQYNDLLSLTYETGKLINGFIRSIKTNS